MSIEQQSNGDKAKIQESGFQGIDLFLLMLLGFSGWEGKDNGSLIAGLAIGSVCAILYLFASRLYSNFSSKAWTKLPKKFTTNLLAQAVLNFVAVFINLAFLYFPFLFLVWKTNNLYVTLFCRQ